ncbi:MAG: peptidoglycan editing factor PgeF [Candidatus Nanopelagicales bacterium]
MIRHRLDLALTGGVEARLVFTGRGAVASGVTSPPPYEWANLASHVGDEPAAVTANRSALASAMGLEPSQLSFMHPDHGRGVAVVTQPGGVAPSAEIQHVDAMVTDRPGIGLVALSADCVPALLVDPDARIIAAVHAGWRGMALDVVGAAVERMVAMGGTAERIQAYLGPAICGRCYPVPPERAEQVRAVRPEAVTRAPDGQPAIDVRIGLAARLRELGARIDLVGGCTAEDAGLYSHRRDGRTGRQAGAITIVPGQT